MLALRVRHLVARAQLLLDVVAHLVGDHVRPREVAARAELVLHVAVEAQVEVDTLIRGAVERPDRRGGRAAAGLYAAAVEDELRVLVRLALLGQRFLPPLLGPLEDVDREVLQVAVGVLAGGDPTRGLASRRLRGAAERVVHAADRAATTA